jgi:cyclic beta-1,2-glucan synthetase
MNVQGAGPSGPLEAFARELQKHHKVSGRDPQAILAWVELRSLLHWLIQARTAAATAEPDATKAAEWLLDNDYQVQRAVLQIGQHLPAAFYRRLPRLTTPGLEGLPRIFVLAHGVLQASHLQLSLSTAIQFVRAYQDAAPLTIAELWAFPTMLRLACLEILVAAFARLFPNVPTPFEPSQCACALGGLDDTECVARALANLGMIASIQWRDFFEGTSRVEEILARDPAAVYARMDFETRDRYRKAVEVLADSSSRSEWFVAEAVLAQSRAAKSGPRASHIGYWLVGDGRSELENTLGFRRTAATRRARAAQRHAGLLFASALAMSGMAALILPTLYLRATGAEAPILIFGVALALTPASVLSVTLVHWIVTVVVPPRVLPKLDFDKAIPADCATVVVIPVLIATPAEVPALVQRLEMHHLANPDPSLQFALLTDHSDAPDERMPGDAEIEQVLVRSIQHLNGCHGRGGNGPFHLLHRPRRFNPSERCWMGWERKRGKIEQFNDFVLTGNAGTFSVREGNTDALRGARFVVTADADTSLPPGSVSRLVATLAHPLNRAEFDVTTGRVRTGYTIVQPRVEILPGSVDRSIFSRLYAGDTAIDIYSRAVSDVYQDVFGSAIYIGKGIYEVATFQRSLERCVPDNALVSHDLFEGVHGRTALASDIVLYESFPAGYIDYAKRWHRWVRGDWQLLPWLWSTAPRRNGLRAANRLSWLDRWKIFDNLRRSLVPLSLIALVAAGWLVLPGNPWVWTGLTLVVPGAHLFTDLVTGLSRGRRRGAVHSTLRRFANQAGRWLLAIVFLLQDAAVSTDAIARTVWRLLVSRQNFLEWTPAAHSATLMAARRPRAYTWRLMWISPAFSAALGVAISVTHPAALLPAAPLLLLWLTSPEFAIWISRPLRPLEEDVAAEDVPFLRRLARRTWLYFETFVGPDDNWLPPDNIQEEPYAEIAHRTSPTNMGMMFLSSLTAWDLGYVGLNDLAARIRGGLDTLDRLERYRGHFLNWYDTRSLKPLEPRYVSTVDSGNLAVSLVALKQGALDAARGPALRSDLWDGLRDTLDLLAAALESSSTQRTDACKTCVRPISERVLEARNRPDLWWTVLNDLCERQYPRLESTIGQAVAQPGKLQASGLREIHVWLERLHHHLASMRRDIETFLPWLPLIESPPYGCQQEARRIGKILSPAWTLAEARDGCNHAREMLARCAMLPTAPAVVHWFSALEEAIERGARAQGELGVELRVIAARSETLAFEMDFRLLFDENSRLFHIGYNVSFDRIDPHHYDLLASEARLASFFAIAKGDVRPAHWFFLGRPITRMPVGLSLVSWNGSMFEYLMPTLLLRSDPTTLLGQSDRAAVDIQRRYARTLGVPWGMSESAFAARDAGHRYRYRAFGVPDLGLRRGLSRDVVVAPYATALALGVRPGLAARNLRRLEQLGAARLYGFLEAIDFTTERLPTGRRFSAVHAYMAHHQGMILAALGNALCAKVLMRRFHADPRIQAIELLLYERIPWELPPEIGRVELRETPRPSEVMMPVPHPWVPTIGNDFPNLQALGNGRIASWISEAGAGCLRWHQHMLTRWLPDATRDEYGLWVYVSDEENCALWSVGRQPTGLASQDARVVFHSHQVEFHRREHDIAISMEVGVAPGDDLEIRRLTVTNESERPRRLRLTTYGEVVLAPAADDERHPAFSKLFVGSEYLPGFNGLLFTRRPCRPSEKPPVMLHRVVSDQPSLKVTGFETDRRAFLGRNGNARRPAGVSEGLTGTTGWTLDPAMALQVELPLAPHEQRQFAFLTIAAGSRESVLELAERYATLASIDWALGDAATEAVHEAHRLGLDPADLPALQVLSSLLLQPHPALRAEPATIAANRLGQPDLWRLGISGDYPILVLRAHDARETNLLALLSRALQLWRRRGVHIDLVVLRTTASGYVEPLRERVLSVLQDAGAQELLGHSGGIHLIFADQVGVEDVRLLESAAGVVLDEAMGPLERQLVRATHQRVEPPRFEAAGVPVPEHETPLLVRPANLLFDNGIGGFSRDEREYVIHLAPDEHTPAPWANVLANHGFGSIVTEAGLGFSWAMNSGENRLTPCSNDPVADPPAEALYLRDEESGLIWTPTPQPAGDGTACQIRHGAGYTRWRQCCQGLEQELLVFVPVDDPVKVVRLRLRNSLPRTRRITATYYAEWLLGALRSRARAFVVSGYDAANHALTARNPWNPEFSHRVAFLASSRPPHSLTTNRQSFLGREGEPRQPAGLLRWDLGGNLDPGMDACAAFQVHLDIGASATTEVVFVLGQGDDLGHAQALVKRWQEPARIEQAFEAVVRHWDQLLGAVQVRTPDPSFDLMVNRWLLYQTLTSRVLARAGFHQAGGAIGFRDQLQDVLALLHADPGRARAHILTCAARQFEEGDVLHWWHPPLDRGVRTRCSDDLLWLPYATSHYVGATGDTSILDEEIPFLRALPLAPDEDDRYARFDVTSEPRPLFEHCERALERGVTKGTHGLPLIGSGDWNDGMNRVGRQGRGESVWLAWFAIAAMRGFVDLAVRLQRDDLAGQWTARAEDLHRAVENEGWDGGWYLRALDDDGRPWGSASNDECRIDSVTQSWAVLSGGGAPDRSRAAIEAAGRELIREDDRLIRLLWPPFLASPRDPGYIKAYPPGVRENGGHYTHAAAWLGCAAARIGDGDLATCIFRLVNPVNHSTSRNNVERYRAEPYVLAADISSVEPYVGRGGWTWYTGSAAWTWRLGIEEILGLRLKDGKLLVDPRLPSSWDGFEATVRGPAGSLHILIDGPDHVDGDAMELTADGVVCAGSVLSFPTDGSVRHVHVRFAGAESGATGQTPPRIRARD